MNLCSGSQVQRAGDRAESSLFTPCSPPLPKLPAISFTLADYRALAAGVVSVSTNNYYASQAYLWGNGTAIVADSSGNAVISASTYGAGRVLQAGHEGMLSECCSATGTGLSRLFYNAAQWAGSNAVGGSIRVAYSTSFTSTFASALVSAVRYPLAHLQCPAVPCPCCAMQCPAALPIWPPALITITCPLLKSSDSL